MMSKTIIVYNVWGKMIIHIRIYPYIYESDTINKGKQFSCEPNVCSETEHPEVNK